MHVEVFGYERSPRILQKYCVFISLLNSNLHKAVLIECSFWIKLQPSNYVLIFWKIKIQPLTSKMNISISLNSEINFHHNAFRLQNRREKFGRKFFQFEIINIKEVFSSWQRIVRKIWFPQAGADKVQSSGEFRKLSMNEWFIVEIICWQLFLPLISSK